MRQLALILFLLISGNLFSGDILYKNKLNQQKINEGQTRLYLNLPFDSFYSQTKETKKEKLVVSLEYSKELDLSLINTSMSWDYEVYYDVYVDDSLWGSDTLFIEFSPSSGVVDVIRDYVIYDIDTLHNAKVEITGRSGSYTIGASTTNLTSSSSPAQWANLPLDINLEVEYINETYFAFNHNLISTGLASDRKLNLRYDETENLIKWRAVIGAEEYELQWLYFDSLDTDYESFSTSYSGTTIETEIWKGVEPVSIRTRDTKYMFDEVQTRGVVVFRVRPIRRFINDSISGEENTFDNYKVPLYDNWYYVDKNGNNAFIRITGDEVFEGGKNWTYSAQFGDNGKYSSSVAFYDGSLRARQGVTYNNSDDISLVSETKYDYEGREAVSVIPAPFQGKNFAYQEGLNNVSSGGTQVFEKEHFDIETPLALLNTTGASKYFSSNNSFSNDLFRDNIPDANGYVYSQVRFTKDGTGKVRSQSGIGEEFASNPSGHITQIFYPTPTVFELQRLFGSNVGNVSFYEKKLVVDPNGQINVTYLDREGRTVATAFQGDSPDNVQELDGTIEQTVTTPLSVFNVTDNEYAHESAQKIAVPIAYVGSTDNPHSFSYSASDLFAGVEKNYDIYGNQISICTDCVYKLTFWVESPDGSHLANSAGDTLVTEYFTGDALLNCGDTYDAEDSLGSTEFDFGTFYFVDAGEYIARKRLEVDLDSMQENFLVSAELELDSLYGELFVDNLASINFQDCYDNCEEYTYAKARMLYDSLPNNDAGDFDLLGTSVQDSLASIWMGECEIDSAMAEALAEGGMDNMGEGLCHGILTQIVIQVSPGHEVYDNADSTVTTISEDFWSTVSTKIGSGDIILREGYDGDGIGFGDTLSNSTADLDFIKDEDNFLEEWAYELAKAHREYCHYEFCDLTSGSREWQMLYSTPQDSSGNDRWKSTWDATSSSPDIGDYNDLYSDLTSSDPFFDELSDLNDYIGCGDTATIVTLDSMLQDVYNYDSLLVGGGTLGTNFSVTRVIEAINDDYSALITQAQGMSPAPLILTTDEEEFKWSMFIGRYNTYKEHIVERYKKTSCDTCEYYDDDFSIVRNTINESQELANYPNDPTAYNELVDGILDTNTLELIIDDSYYESQGEALATIFSDTCISWMTTQATVYRNTNDTIQYLDSAVSNLYLEFLFYMEINTQEQLDDTVYFAEGIYDNGQTANSFDTLVLLINRINGNGGCADCYYFTRFTKSGVSCMEKCRGISLKEIACLEFPSDSLIQEDCISDVIEEAELLTNTQINNLTSNMLVEFLDTINCMEGINEDLTMEYTYKEGYFTLYYYDQAGNLVQTVPPQGVHPLDATDIADTLNHRNHDLDDIYVSNTQPEHTHITRYYYDGANQLIAQNTPDGGTSNFLYDDLKRLRFSQNAKQEEDNSISYTKFDELGRIVEAGEAKLVTAQSWSTIQSNNKVEDTSYPSASDVTYYPAYTKSFYDVVYDWSDTITGVNVQSNFDDRIEMQFKDGQRHLRNRISGILTVEQFEPDPDNPVYSYGYTNATFNAFGYDVQGNVSEYVTFYPELTHMASNPYDPLKDVSFAKVDYEFDLISGNTEKVIYQKDKKEQFIHKYTYDAVNRLRKAMTSEDDIIYNLHSKSFYYLHGPLARMEIGDEQVQGIDYAYTLQGWIKGVNGNTAKEANDIGLDGVSGLNKRFGADSYGYMLGYFTDDYSAINDTNSFVSTSGLATLNGNSKNLYNGNISHMVTVMRDENEEYIDVIGNNYKYDQLQRIKSMNVHIDNSSSQASTGLSWTGASEYANHRYNTSYSYDLNGNITDLVRHSSGYQSDGTTALVGGVNMDSLSYAYLKINRTTGSIDTASFYNDDRDDYIYTNRLSFVKDDHGTVYGEYVDLKTQSINNYSYNKIGQLVGDDASHIDKIHWTPSGKVQYIEFSNSTPDIQFTYDANGNRNRKISYISSDEIEVTYYTTDASGNPLAHYKRVRYDYDYFDLTGSNGDNFEKWSIEDYNLYGSSRLGNKSKSDSLLGYTDFNGMVTASYYTSYDNSKTERGTVSYELSNHLGNVLEVISDKKLFASDYDDSTIYSADIISYTDYYPFGMQIIGRSGNTEAYKYGFQGQEKDKEIRGEGNSVNYRFRMHDVRIGRFFAIDPLAPLYPHNSPYAFSENVVIHAVELEGLEKKEVNENEYEKGKFKIDPPKNVPVERAREFVKVEEEKLVKMEKLKKTPFIAIEKEDREIQNREKSKEENNTNWGLMGASYLSSRASTNIKNIIQHRSIFSRGAAKGKNMWMLNKNLNPVTVIKMPTHGLTPIGSINVKTGFLIRTGQFATGGGYLLGLYQLHLLRNNKSLTNYERNLEYGAVIISMYGWNGFLFALGWESGRWVTKQSWYDGWVKKPLQDYFIKPILYKTDFGRGVREVMQTYGVEFYYKY